MFNFFDNVKLCQTNSLSHLMIPLVVQQTTGAMKISVSVFDTLLFCKVLWVYNIFFPWLVCKNKQPAMELPFTVNLKNV